MSGGFPPARRWTWRALILRAAANSASVSMQVSKHVISVVAALWLLIVVALWEVASVLVVVWLWLLASLPWPGVGAFAGSAAHAFTFF